MLIGCKGLGEERGVGEGRVGCSWTYLHCETTTHLDDARFARVVMHAREAFVRVQPAHGAYQDDGARDAVFDHLFGAGARGEEDAAAVDVVHLSKEKERFWSVI